MRIIDPTEIGYAMDVYGLQLAHAPEVIPTIGFTVLQAAVDLDKVNTWAELGIGNLLHLLDYNENASDFDMVTLRKTASDSSVEAYRLALHCTDSERLPAKSATDLTRKGKAISAETYTFDRQGNPTISHDPSLQRLHINLARHVLLSSDASEKVQKLKTVRQALEQELRSPKLSPARRKGIAAGLKEAKLK